MFNTRPLTDAKTEEARQLILAILDEYDLAGAVLLVNADEAGFAYKLPASWSAITYDAATPLGFRIRAQSAESGHEAAHARIEATAHTLCQLSDFGAQTYKWANDLLRILQKHGIHIEHQPFGGEELGTIGAYEVP